MTQRLYYTEPSRRSFDGTVVTVSPANNRLHVILDQTAFYPTSGGQPFDTGTLGGAAVVDVIDNEDGTITHVVSGSLRPGEVVTGEIDWARRYLLMRYHTATHVLTGVMFNDWNVRVTGNQLTPDKARVDFAFEHFDRDTLDEGFRRAATLLRVTGRS